MIIDALRKKYEYEIASAKANIEAYRINPTGIGEHPDLVDAVDSEMAKLDSALSKLQCVETQYPAQNHGSLNEAAEDNQLNMKFSK